MRQCGNAIFFFHRRHRNRCSREHEWKLCRPEARLAGVIIFEPVAHDSHVSTLIAIWVMRIVETNARYRIDMVDRINRVYPLKKRMNISFSFHFVKYFYKLFDFIMVKVACGHIDDFNRDLMKHVLKLLKLDRENGLKTCSIQSWKFAEKNMEILSVGSLYRPPLQLTWISTAVPFFLFFYVFFFSSFFLSPIVRIELQSGYFSNTDENEQIWHFFVLFGVRF